jgi:hypothetical protein
MIVIPQTPKMVAVAKSARQVLFFRILAPTLLANFAAAQLVISNFSAYPVEARSCLLSAADNSGCNLSASLHNLNECLCSNDGGFATNSASCVASNDPDDLQSVYKAMLNECDTTDTPLNLTYAQFTAANAGQTRTTLAASSTSAVSGSPSPSSISSSSSPTADAGSSNTSLANGSSDHSNQIAIGLGLGIGIPSVLIALAAWWFPRARKRERQRER